MSDQTLTAVDAVGDLRVSREGHVATVVINRPPENFFDVALIADLVKVFQGLDADPACRAIVLASEGKAFCAGANFSRSDEARAKDGGPGPLYEVAVKLFECRKPVVAAVQGAAIGGGLGLALVADFRVASPQARFGANFVKLGIHPGFGLTHTLPRLIGSQRAQLLFYTGRRIDAEQALAWGLVDQLVPPEDLRRAAAALAAEIAENAPLAVMSTRETLRKGLAETVASQTARELAEQTWMFQTADYREGVRAVMQRRPGDFIGA